MGAHGEVESIVIVGGGTAGWMTAAALAHKLAKLKIPIALVESEAIGSVGVGEATLPHIRFFNRTLGIDEPELMAATEATFKLGIEFCDWGRLGDRYIHPFGDYGEPLGGVAFHQLWRKARAAGDPTPIDAYSLPVMAAQADRFAPPQPDVRALMGSFSYAFQFDAGRYARFLRAYAEARGVTRAEGRVSDVELRGTDGFVEAVVLDDGRRVAGDLFIDCSGFRSLLLGGALGVAFEDWSRFLPCDRAVTAPCERTDPLTPYTRATARDAGWQWRIPLQHRTGAGYVYSSAHVSDDAAADTLLDHLCAPALADPRTLRFTAGKRRRMFDRNVVAIGLSSGFLEPLESTSIHLIQEGVTQLLELFPDKSCDPADRDEYNRIMDLQFERIRDFLILHYVATRRDDTPFWRDIQAMTIPDTLAAKIAAFRERGLVVRYENGLFLPPSWVAVFVGQNVLAERTDPCTDRLADDALAAELARIRAEIARAVAGMPDHAAFIEAYGAASGSDPLTAA